MTSILRYDPYGQITCGAPVQDTIFGYNGEQYTPQTGLIYLRARNYDPSTGTFTTKDTYLGNKLEPVTRNRYTYGNNNPITYQDPSGHKGVYSRAVAAVKQTAHAVAKTVAKTVHTAAKVVQSTARAATQTVQKVVTTVKQTAQKAVSVVKNTAQTVRKVVNAAKTEVVTATRAVVNKATGAVSTVVHNVSNAVSVMYNTAYEIYTDAAQCIAEAKETVRNYIDTKVKSAKAVVKQTWEDSKDVMEDGLRVIISAKHSVAETVQEAGAWWQETPMHDSLSEAATVLSFAYKCSPIGLTRAAIQYCVDKAGTVLKDKWDNSPLGQFVNNTVNSAVEFYHKHEAAINVALSVAVIAICVVAVVATGGLAGCGLASAMAVNALNGAVAGAIGGAVFGTLNGAISYMEEHDTLDGSREYIRKAAAKETRNGAAIGGITGAIAGGLSWAKNPTYCFVAGTLVLTATGMVAIEELQPGDMVYAMEAIGEEQCVDVDSDIDRKTILQTYIHETDETYVVTIDGEEIETTAEHPFYNAEGEQVAAKDLQEGDSVTTADGDTKTVDAVTCIHHDEPVRVYNIAVCDDHTYFVGKTHVLVHNACQPTPSSAGDISGNALSEGGNTTRRQAFREAKEATGIPKSSEFKTHKFVHDGTSEHRIVYEFEVDSEKKYIIEHSFDKMGRGKHFHGADALKGNPFNRGRYNQLSGHFPEDFNGFL